MKALVSLTLLLGQVSEERLRAHLDTLVAFGTRASHAPSQTQGRGVAAARDWLKGRFEALAPGIQVTLHPFDMPSRFKEDTGKTFRQHNVVALLKGHGHPRQVIVVGAHYDSINMKDRDPEAPAPGANDDGSGTVALLELAACLRDLRLDRSVMLVAFAGEEHGLKGSAAFVPWVLEQDFEVVAMLNNDIIGGVNDAPDGKNALIARCFADPKHPPSTQLMRWAKRTADPILAPLTLSLQPTLDRPRRAGDHVNFSKAGLPAIRFTEQFENFDRQHNAEDTVAHVQFAYLKRMVQLNLVLVEGLARGTNIPPP